MCLKIPLVRDEGYKGEKIYLKTIPSTQRVSKNLPLQGCNFSM